MVPRLLFKQEKICTIRRLSVILQQFFDVRDIRDLKLLAAAACNPLRMMVTIMTVPPPHAGVYVSATSEGSSYLRDKYDGLK